MQQSLSDLEAFHAGQKWGTNRLGDDLSESLRLSVQKVSATVERIASESLRNDIKSIKIKITSTYVTRSEHEAIAAYNEVSHCYGELMERLGTVLRSHY